MTKFWVRGDVAQNPITEKVDLAIFLVSEEFINWDMTSTILLGVSVLLSVEFKVEVEKLLIRGGL